MSRSVDWQRFLDYWMGVPILAATAALRRRRDLPRKPQRIGFISPTAIGDLILQSGLISHLGNLHPSAAFHLFHGKNNSGVVPMLPAALNAHRCEFTNIRATANAIRRADLDILVDLTPWPRLTALYAASSNATTVGFQSEGQLRHFAFDISVPHLRTRHETDNLRAMAEVFGNCPNYRLLLRDDLPEPPKTLPYDRLVLCHAAPGGSRAKEKSWPKEHWAELISRLVGRGFVVGITGTDADGALAAAILQLSKVPPASAFPLCGTLALVELAATLRAARLLITVDTGVLHLASALEVPTVALHGPTRSERWGSRSPTTISLDASHPEAGFIHLGFERSRAGSEIMSTLSVDQAYTAALSILDSQPQQLGQQP